MIEKYFESIKGNTPELIMFLKAMPKGADLHNHVLGASYSEFIYDDAIKYNDYYDLRNNFFLTKNEYSNSDKSNQIINIETFKKFYYNNMFDSYSIRGIDKNYHDKAKHFFNTFFGALSSKRTENDMIVEIIKRNLSQNIKYLELISDCISREVENNFRNVMNKMDFNINDLEKYCKILDTLDNEENFEKVKNLLDERENVLTENGVGNFTVKYIPILKRVSSSLNEFTAETYCYMLYCIKEDRIAAVNIVEPEDVPASRENFESHIKIIRFIYNYLSNKYSSSNKKINLTLHAGELCIMRSPLEDMNDRICSSIFLTRDKNEQKLPYTKRIGHGVSIFWEENADSLLKFMSINKVAVEICLTSNEIILGIKGKDHPLPLYLKYNVPIVICTDDEGVNRSNLTLEYLKAIQNYNLDYNTIKDIVRNSIEFSFLSGESLFIDNDYKNIREEFRNIGSIDKWKEKFLEHKDLILNNEKLKKQIELEIDFMIFENSYNN